MRILIIFFFTLALLLSGCGDAKQAKEQADGGMKCGAGKCGSVSIKTCVFVV